MEKDIHRLIMAYLRKEISDAEKERLNEWLDGEERHRQLFRELCDRQKVQEEVEQYALFDTEQAWLSLEQAMDRTLSRKKIWRLWQAYAAGVMLIIGVGLFWLYRTEPAGTVVAEQKSIMPGETTAILVLENGQEIVLQGMKDTCLVLGKGEVLRVNREEELTYDVTVWQGGPERHILKVPRGGEYKITLDDGTEVWMNSASELSYPVHFTGLERRVRLSGEAYFQVARNEHMPFIVETKGMDIRVLGTVFNVMAYADESKSVVTLVEGKVQVHSAEEQTGVILQPGEQVAVGKEGMTVRQVNTKFATSWIHDRFAFEHEKMEEVMRKLARWYNVDFIFVNPDRKQKSFTGSLPKYADVSKVLKIMEMTTNVRFEVKGETIEIR